MRGRPGATDFEERCDRYAESVLAVERSRCPAACGPGMLEEILFLPPVTGGREGISERQARQAGGYRGVAGLGGA